jgi:transketolase
MQKAYITQLYEIMKQDYRVCSLLSDSGTDYDIMMARDFPRQCFNFGIAEQHKVAAASGMAAMGKIPFVYTTGAFIAYRAYEFVRDDVCFQKRNVKLVGMGMGMGSWSTLGVSHHTTEDLAALRALPNLTLMCAATPIELKKMIQAAYETDGPVYVRMGMSNEDEFYPEDYDFQAGRLSTIIDIGDYDYTVFVTGTVAGEAFKAVTRLNEAGYVLRLVNVHTLKPLDVKGILACAKNKVFTVEEHNIFGGLGGAVAEVLAENACAVPLIRIGLADRFAEGYGRTNEIRAMNGLDAEGIYNQIQRHLSDRRLKTP